MYVPENMVQEAYTKHSTKYSRVFIHIEDALDSCIVLFSGGWNTTSVNH